MSLHQGHHHAHTEGADDLPPGIAADRPLPDPHLAWDHLFLPDGVKESLLNHALFSLLHRRKLAADRGGQHGLVLLAGPPGTGKTTAARGLADAVANQLADRGVSGLVELDAHAVPSDMLGQSQRNVTRLLLRTIPELAERRDFTVVLIDEIEAFATSRHHAAFETNPVDLHRATDAVLWGLDRLAVEHSDVLLVGTTNFEQAVDAALLSRAGVVLTLGRPDRETARRIVADSLRELGEIWPDLAWLADADGLIDKLGEMCEGWDGRRIRGLAHTALTMRTETALDPTLLTKEDVVAAAELLASTAEGAPAGGLEGRRSTQ